MILTSCSDVKRSVFAYRFPFGEISSAVRDLEVCKGLEIVVIAVFEDGSDAEGASIGRGRGSVTVFELELVITLLFIEAAGCSV